MQKARLIWSRVLIVGVLGLMLWGVLGHPAVSSVQGQVCLPLPGIDADLPPRIYLPLVMGRDAAGSCAVELENNDVHDLAQDLITCVAGQSTTGIDADWYRLSACQGPIDLELVLESDGHGDVDLYLYGDPPDTPLAASESGGGQESIIVTDLVTGTYYAAVLPAIGAPADPARGIPYTLSVEATWAE